MWLQGVFTHFGSCLIALLEIGMTMEIFILFVSYFLSTLRALMRSGVDFRVPFHIASCDAVFFACYQIPSLVSVLRWQECSHHGNKLYAAGFYRLWVVSPIVLQKHPTFSGSSPTSAYSSEVEKGPHHLSRKANLNKKRCRKNSMYTAFINEALKRSVILTRLMLSYKRARLDATTAIKMC